MNIQVIFFVCFVFGKITHLNKLTTRERLCLSNKWSADNNLETNPCLCLTKMVVMWNFTAINCPRCTFVYLHWSKWKLASNYDTFWPFPCSVVYQNHMCIDTGAPKTINFPFVPNGKLIILGALILKHIRVSLSIIINNPTLFTAMVSQITEMVPQLFGQALLALYIAVSKYIENLL